MSAHPLEALLRPPIEFWVTAGCVAAALIAAKLPWQSAAVTRFDVAFFLITGILFAVGGVRVLRYQRCLRVLKPYQIDEALVPSREGEVLLGLGFVWEPVHAQRVLDTQTQSGCPYLRPRRWEPEAPSAGKVSIHGVGFGEQDIWEPDDVFKGHVGVYGVNGAGKTTFIRWLAWQHSARDAALIFFDPKNTPELAITAQAIAAVTDRHFYHFDLANPDVSVRYNPLGRYDRITELATRTTGLVSQEGEGAAFADYAWLFVNLIAQALAAMDQDIELDAISRYLPQPDILLVRLYDHLEGATRRPQKKDKVEARGWDETAARIAKHLKVNPSDHLILNKLADVLRFSGEYYSKISNAAQPQLEKLLTGEVGQLFLPDDEHESFSWEQAIQERAVVLVTLATLGDPEVGNNIARMMFADLSSQAGQMLVDRRYVETYVHMDEFTDLLGAWAADMFNKSRQSGFVLFAYTQVYANLEAELGHSAKAKQIAGNFNSTIMLRVEDLETAEQLTRKLPKVKVLDAVDTNMSVDSSDPESGISNVARRGDSLAPRWSEAIPPDLLMSLPDGHGFALMKGKPPIKFRFPLLG